MINKRGGKRDGFGWGRGGGWGWVATGRTSENVRRSPALCLDAYVCIYTYYVYTL